MNEAEKMGFVKQAQSELQQRVTQTSRICDQFKKSYSDYSSNFAQIAMLVVFAFFMSLFIWAMFNIDTFLTMFSTRNYDRDLLLAKAALTGMCLYIALHICKKIICILRIAKIDGHISNVRNIEKYLRTKLNNIGSIAAEADKLVFGGANKRLGSEYDVDADIAKYSSLVKTYSNSDNSLLNIALTITHWLSGVLFVCVFLLISTPSSAGKTGESGHNAFIYTAFFLLLYVILQELYAKNIIEDLHNKIKKTFGILFIIGFCAALIYWYFGSGYVSPVSVVFGNLIASNYSGFIKSMSMPYIPIVIGAVFSSIMCFLCKIEKRVIGILFSVGIFGVFLNFLFGYYSFMFKIEDDMPSGIIFLMFVFYAPLMVAAFFSSFISTMYKMEYMVFGFVVAGIGALNALATIIMFIASEGIQYYLIGEAVLLVVFAIAALIMLLPGIILLLAASFIDSHFKELSSGIIKIAILVVIGLVGLSIKGNDREYSPPPVPVQTVSEKKVTVLPDALNLRAEPSGSAGIIKILYKGNVLTVTGDVSGGWTPVEHEGARGWVSSEFIKLVD